jgi:hypothetical protein
MTDELQAQLITMAIGVLLGWVAKWLKSRADRLPSWIVKWLKLKEISQDELLASVQGFVDEAAGFACNSPQARRDYVVAKVQAWVRRHFGIDIPTSTVNYLVEWVYGRMRAKK